MGNTVAVCYIASCLSFLVSIIMYRISYANGVSRVAMNRLRGMLGAAFIVLFIFSMLIYRFAL